MRLALSFCSFFLLAVIVSPISHAHRIEQESDRIIFEITIAGKQKPTGFRWPFKKRVFEIKVTITNETDQTTYFEKPVRFSNLHFVVMDPAGEDVQLSPDMANPSIGPDHFVRISPQESYSETYNLLDLGRSRFRYQFRKGNLYNIYARYSSGYEMEKFKHFVKDRDAGLFQGQLESNISSFEW